MDEKIRKEFAECQSFIEGIKNEIQSLDEAKKNDLLGRLFTCIDNTTLNGSDTPASVAAFCRSTVNMSIPFADGFQRVASVCVYPVFVALAKKELQGSGIKVASVAGGFPAGQTPLKIKNEEVRYVVEEGADEVDIVINRGRFLSGDDDYVSDEVASAKSICGERVKLKVIIECGELQSMENIYRASLLALNAGADFIKTSTGKIAVGATPEAAFAMLMALREYVKISKKTVGFKAAGGVSTPADAMIYGMMYEKILCGKSVNNQNFRIGTSRLTAQLAKILTF